MNKKTNQKITSTTESGPYAVFRSNIRVSERIYDTIDESLEEFNHWKKIVKKWPDGTLIEVLPIN